LVTLFLGPEWDTRSRRSFQLRSASRLSLHLTSLLRFKAAVASPSPPVRPCFCPPLLPFTSPPLISAHSPPLCRSPLASLQKVFFVVSWKRRKNHHNNEQKRITKKGLKKNSTRFAEAATALACSNLQ